jgi:putative sterol carrier protein
VTAPLPIPVFSDAWALACAEALERRPAYRVAAAQWEGAVMLVMHAEGGRQWRVLLDLWRGECRLARAATAEDEVHARYVLSATLLSWRALLTGQLAPILAVMTGKLRLVKGNLAELIPYAGVAKELVGAAAEVPAVFPEDP